MEGNKYDLKKSELCHNSMQMSVTFCEGMDNATFMFNTQQYNMLYLPLQGPYLQVYFKDYDL